LARTHVSNLGASLTVLVVDRRRLERVRLRAALVEAGVTVVADVASIAAAVAAARQLRPGAVLVDPGLPGSTGADVCRHILAAAPETAVVVLSSRGDRAAVGAALEAGARGYVVKTGRHEAGLPAILRRAVHGDTVLDRRAAAALEGVSRPGPRRQPMPMRLSERERAVLALVVEGLTNAEIGARLYLSRHTVKEYLSGAMRKLGVSSRVEAALEATRRGLVAGPRDGHALPDDRHLRAVPDLAVDGWTTISLAGVADADIAVAPLKVRRAAAS
jgi:DNA-binding NarL/FixJ family response regulator